MYGRFGFLVKLYTYIRVFTAPLFEVEKYVPKSGNIIDIGCGSGIFSNLLCIMSEERRVIGFDVSRKRIERADNTIRDGNQLSFYLKDVEDVSFDDFSVITVIDLLHHIPYQDQDRLLKRIYHSLQIPGLLILKDLAKKPFWKYVCHYLQDLVSYRSKLFFRSSWETRKILKDIGFKVNVIPLESWLPYPHILFLCKKL